MPRPRFNKFLGPPLFVTYKRQVLVTSDMALSGNIKARQLQATSLSALYVNCLYVLRFTAFGRSARSGALVVHCT